MFWNRKKEEKLLRSFTKAHAGHVSHITQLRACRDVLVVQMDDVPKFTIHCGENLQVIADLTDGMLRSLEGHAYMAGETLARVVIEQTIDLLYVLHEEGNSRLDALLKDMLDRHYQHACDWAVHARTSGNALDAKSAERKRAYIDNLRMEHRSWYKDAPAWPDMAQRAAETGFEAYFYYVFSPAHDTTQTCAENVLHAMRYALLPRGQRENAVLAWRAERTSMSIFIATYALWFFLNAINRLALTLEASEGRTRITKTLQTEADALRKIMDEHEQLTAVYKR